MAHKYEQLFNQVCADSDEDGDEDEEDENLNSEEKK